jgi:hypothetical protein
MTAVCSADFSVGAKNHPRPVTKVTPGEVWNLIKYRSIFTLRGLGPSRPEALRESLGGRISFVVQGSQYIYTASPWTPRICTLRNFRNIEEYTSSHLKNNNGRRSATRKPFSVGFR